jgi:hypothetical protein
MACMTPSKNFFEGNRACAFAKFLDVLDSLIDFPLPAVRLRNNSRYGPAVPGDDDRLAAFDLVEQLREAGLRFGGLYFSCHLSFDQSIWLVKLLQRR